MKVKQFVHTYSFWLRVLFNPAETLDLVDQDGRPDHGKILPAILLLSAIALQFLDKQYAVGVLVVLGSLSYGYGMFRTLLKSKTVTASEATVRTESVIRHIVERRKQGAADGTEPT